jgi:hypothetical protein
MDVEIRPASEALNKENPALVAIGNARFFPQVFLDGIHHPAADFGRELC